MDNTPEQSAEYFSAPLVDLANTDVSKLTPDQRNAYLRRIREVRASKATMKAKTSRASNAKASKHLQEFL